ncbi:hypothetical protein MHTCC0001_35500 [Flavobacteriaceae bacterium MHTCC 0001]
MNRFWFGLIILFLLLITPFYRCKEVKRNNSNYRDVLEFYSRDDSDSLKLKAAYFLIENMKKLISFDTKGSPLYNDFFLGIKNFNNNLSLLNEKERNLILRNLLEEKIDSIWSQAITTNNIDFREVKVIPDTAVVTSNQLIDNIELAFDVWEAPWAKDLSFKNFCEFILPYKGFDEPFENWRQEYMENYLWVIDSMKGSDDRVKACDLINDELNSWFMYTPFFMNKYPIKQSSKQILMSKFGKCSDQVNLALYAMRSVGIPVTKDFTPLWGNHKTGHSWNALLLKNGKSVNFQGASNGIGTQIFPYKLSKVYRSTYAENKNSLASRVTDLKKIPPYLRDSYFIDVSGDYTEVFTSKPVNIEIKYKSSTNEKYAYLCTFNNEKWEAITWAEIKNNTMFFKNVGTEVVYLLAYYIDGKYIPAQDPFVLEKNGGLRFLSVNEDYHNIKIERKFPNSSDMKWRANQLKEGIFQGANKPDFSDAENLYVVNDGVIKSHYVQIKLTNAKKFRYVRFLLDKTKNTEIAELSFYTKEGGKHKLLSGDIITSIETDKVLLNKIFDGKTYNYFSFPKQSNVWYGLDLGKPKFISQVGYCPRNDSNNVEPNDLYELLYWDKKWVSLGKKMPKTYHLNYANVPKNALFWLQNLTKGKEERIFTYEDEKQIWW